MQSPEVKDDDSEDSDDIESAMGFMFDSSHARICMTFDIGTQYMVKLRMIKGDPGHVQSGQYLWPAAHFAAKWLVARQHEDWLNSTVNESIQVIELGAGCGLAGLALAQLPAVSKVILTDYDYGSLQLLEANVIEAKSLESAREKSFLVASLKWGSSLPAELHTSLDSAHPVLVVGTDLIYSRDVIRPLFQTAVLLLKYYNRDDHFPGSVARFVLFSSFDISDYDSELAAVCADVGLSVVQLESLMVCKGASDSRSRVQLFTLTAAAA